MKIDKALVKKPPLLNVSIQRAVLDAVDGDFLNALIIEYIHYRFTKNDNKPVWLMIDWIHEKLPYISRSGIAKKIDKLVEDGHIMKKEGEGRHYHKCWYSPSPAMLEACSGEDLDQSKVYYNLDMAPQDLDASVIYATIVNLLKVNQNPTATDKSTRKKATKLNDKSGEELVLDTAKLVEGSGLSLAKVRKAVAWLIKNKKIVAKKGFGNKRTVSMPAEVVIQPRDLAKYLDEDLPSESYPHEASEDEMPTESFPDAK